MSRKIKDLKGKKFGKLTVLELTKEKDGSSVVWKCRCDCGKTTFVPSYRLSVGGTKSCGCLRNKDLKGKKFGKLTVLDFTDKRVGGSVVWKCRCACGKTTFVPTHSLNAGTTKSCGCFRAYIWRKKMLEYYKDPTEMGGVFET